MGAGTTCASLTPMFGSRWPRRFPLTGLDGYDQVETLVKLQWTDFLKKETEKELGLVKSEQEVAQWRPEDGTVDDLEIEEAQDLLRRRLADRSRIGARKCSREERMGLTMPCSS